MHLLSALALLVFVGSASAFSCSVSGAIGDETLTNVWDASFPITISRCPVYLFYSCTNHLRWAAYLDANKVVSFVCNGVTSRLGVGDSETKCGTTITYDGDGTITVDYNSPIGQMCGLCTATGPDDAANIVQC